jgi:TPR repeat protein
MKDDDAGDAFEKLNRGIALRESGDAQAATKLLLEVGDAGLAQGYYELAEHAYYNQGRRDEVDHWTQRMETLATLNNDDVAHMCCYLVYEFRMGTHDREEREARVKYHLERAAELGNSTGQALLAGCYRSGTAGFTQDAGLYEYWASKAIDQGNVDALCSYIERLVLDGHVVSPELRSKLAIAAEPPQLERLIKDGHVGPLELRRQLAIAAESAQRAADLLRQL